MTNSGDDVLLEIFDIIEKHKAELNGKSEIEIIEGLLVLHRVCLVMLDLHEQNMTDYGFLKDEIENNKKILTLAKERRVLDEDLCTMPKGDA